MNPDLHLWKKSVPSGRVDFWIERLGSSISPERLAVVAPANGQNTRLEVYCETASEAGNLAREFGGRVGVVRAQAWQLAPATSPGRPLAFGGRLWVTGREAELPALRAAHPGKPVLCIPAAMAFGTGEHATTAMCLRMLGETARASWSPWHLLDLGSGSGVLALAGRLFGAEDALGLENDRHAVRTARENTAFNGVRGVRFRRADLLAAWPPDCRKGWQVITANLFSELLTSLLPRIRRALTNDGILIASGVLVTQAAELENAFAKNRLELIDRRQRGKWTAFLVRKAGTLRELSPR